MIALDGKTVRDTFHATLPVHLVSAWASMNQLVLTQVAVANKSNEIIALPLVLGQLGIHGCLVTSDAMGCQRAIAQQIADQGSDYVLAHWGHRESGALGIGCDRGKDASRKRAGHAAEDFATLLRFALNLLRQAPVKKGQCLNAKCLRAGWDPSYLFTLLAAF